MDVNVKYIMPQIIYNVFVQVVAYIGSPFSVDQVCSLINVSKNCLKYIFYLHVSSIIINVF